MTRFNFAPDRRQTASIKWRRYPADVLPMWVADMDMPAPKPILDALRKAVTHGVLGYDFPAPKLKETVAARMEKLYGWKVSPDAVVATTGIVSAFNAAARIACNPRKGMLIQTPVYNEFHSVRRHLDIPQLEAPLVERAEGNVLRYEIDWKVFEKQARKAGMFLLCNPHNPLGIIFQPADLLKMAEICLRYDVLLVSDEIHSELLLGGASFTPLASLAREIEKRTVTLIAPSKTFNVPGLFCGFALIPNREIRKRFEEETNRMTLHVNSLGMVAAQAAFSGACDGWLGELRRHLTANRDFLAQYLAAHLPAVRATFPEATYLGWLDFRQTRAKKDPYSFFLKNGKVALSPGKIFGEGSESFARINFGTTRALLREGLERMRKALEK